jgi:endonuclease/exonuclease/phosphatase family metal-dependent hydrolase
VTIRLLTYNIRQGGAGREGAIAAVVRACAPDIVVLQEATRPASVERIAKEADLPIYGSRRGDSLAFMSRVPIAHHAWHRPRGSRHAFLELVPDAMACRIFGLHLSAVHAAWTEARRRQELGALLASIAEHQHGFHVLAGDFNTLAPDEFLDPRVLPYRLRALVWLSGGKIRWRTIRAVLDAGYIDAFRIAHAGDNKGFTFPTWQPHVRLDYLFVPSPFAAWVSGCEVFRDAPVKDASDHFPLMTTLEVPDAM